MLPSLPARSTSSNLGIGHWALGIGHWALGIGHWALGNLPPLRSEIWYTACERDDCALAPVAAVSRRAEAARSSATSSSAEAARCSTLPLTCVAPRVASGAVRGAVRGAVSGAVSGAVRGSVGEWARYSVV